MHFKKVQLVFYCVSAIFFRHQAKRWTAFKKKGEGIGKQLKVSRLLPGFA